MRDDSSTISGKGSQTTGGGRLKRPKENPHFTRAHASPPPDRFLADRGACFLPPWYTIGG